MENLPVKLLSELLTPEEMIVAGNVRSTHRVDFCPVGIALENESRLAQYHCNGEEFSDFRYTPRAFFAVRVWESARDALLKRPEFAGALAVEWYPVAASFRSVRFVNGGTEKFIGAMFEEMRRTADSGTIDIRYGRFDAPALPERPASPRRFHILPKEILVRMGYGGLEGPDPGQDTPAGPFSWADIKDVFVILKPIQLAFIAGDEMNRHTPLDDEFIRACSDFDIDKVRELVARGANIHAAGKYGDTAMAEMASSYYDDDVDEKGRFIFSNKNHDRFIELTQYLLSLGYNINLAGYEAATCLDLAPHLLDDLELVKFLLDNGADPNIGSYVGEGFGNILGRTVLFHVWEDESVAGSEDHTALAELLLRYGTLPVPKGARIDADGLDAWIEKEKKDGRWDDSLCAGSSKIDAALINCARNMSFYYLALFAQSGGDISVRDARGRNLLLIALESGLSAPPGRRDLRWIKEITLMLLHGLKLKLTAAELEQAKEICRAGGCAELLDALPSVGDPR